MRKTLKGFVTCACITASIFTLVCALGIFHIEKNVVNKLGVKHHQKQVQIENYKPSEGYVPNAQTAIKIAEAVWLPIYGKRIYDEKPFYTNLENGIWTVKGSLPKGHIGGAAEIDISKKDGKILRVMHSK